MRYPQFNFEWFIKKYTKLVRKNSGLAEKIIADSASTRNDIVKLLNADESRVSTVHLAAEEAFRKLGPDELDISLLEKFGITKKYILSVGTIEPRKNYVTLIKAFNYLKSSMKSLKNRNEKYSTAAIRNQTRNPGFDCQLVIVGRTGWLSEAAYTEYESSPFKDDIIFVGRIDDSELVQIYNMAQLFVYPSIFEGFGLPVVEAMQCGLPVLASDTSSIPEIVDNKKLLFNPADEHEIAEKILKILSDGNLRVELSQMALKNAEKFSWEKTARKTLEIYRSVLKQT